MKKKNLPASGENRGNRIRMNRRTFLKLSTFAGAVVGMNQVLRPIGGPAVLSLQKDAQKDREGKWMATSCLNCSARCAIRVRVVKDQAIRITGNPVSLVSEGKICPRAHIGLQVLYDPDRLDYPVKRTVKEKGKEIDPKWVPISWDQALEEITRRLKSLRDRAQPHKLLLFSGLNSVGGEDLISRFADAYGTPNLIPGNSLDTEAEKSGNWMADGHYSHRACDLDQTNYLLAFGADILESCAPLSRFLRKWGKLRRERPNRIKVVVIHPRYSVTAAKSDEWIPINPGTDAALAMAVAHVIISEELYDPSFVHHWTTGFDLYKKLVLTEYSPKVVANLTGIQSEVIQRIAREFAKTQPAIALHGREAMNWPGGSYTGYAIFCLNALVGNVDAPGGLIYQESPKYKDMPHVVKDDIAKRSQGEPRLDFRGKDKFPAAEIVPDLIPESVVNGIPYPVEMAIGLNSNFNMVTPAPQRWEVALSKIPYYVQISPFVSEMAQYADLVLPSTTFLEEWGYDHSPAGSGFAELRIKQPVVRPRGQAKSITEVLFELAKRLNGSVAASFTDIGDGAKGFVRFRTATLLPWEEFLKKGVWIGPKYRYKKYDRLFKTPSRKFEFCSGNLKALLAQTGQGTKDDLDYLPHHPGVKFLGDQEKYPLIFLPYQPLMVIENGSQNYPWAQEIFRPMQGIGWNNLVEINSETAKTLQLEDGKEVWVESPFQKIKAKVKFSEGMHPQVVAVSGGQGHYAYGKWQRDMGVNPNEIIGVDYDRISGQAAFFNTRVRVFKV